MSFQMHPTREDDDAELRGWRASAMKSVATEKQFLAEIERLHGLIEEAHDILNADAGVTDGQRIANATLILAQGLDGGLR